MQWGRRAAALALVALLLPACGQFTGGFNPFPNTVANGLLTGSQVVPALGTGASGTAVVTVDGLQKFIDYTITQTGIVTATAVEIRVGTPGTNGPLLFTLPLGGFPLSGRLTDPGVFTPVGTITSFSQACTTVAGGGTYLLIRSAAQPEGEIRGHLGRATLASATLRGSQETPPLGGTGSGTATVDLDDAQASLTVTVTVSGLSSATTAAQIFDGPPGTAGTTALFTVAPGTFSGSVTAILNSGNFTASAGVATFSDCINALLSGGLFVQVMTATNPGGEIRGQIGPAQLNATLTSADVVPPNTSTATGSATLAFNATQTGLFLTMTHTVSAADRAGIYVEAAGLNGPKIFDLAAIAGAATSPLNATATSINLIKNSGQNIQSFPDAVNAILIKRSYVDVGDLSFPGGEIRGQILP